MELRKSNLLHLLVGILFSLTGAHADATELVYNPVNPSFGGNPNNAPGLLAIAQAQNPFKAPALTGLQSFNNSLQQAILNRLSSQSLATIFGSSSTLVPGNYDTKSFAIQITDAGNGQLVIATTDKATGATVTFTVAKADVSSGP